MCDNVWVSLDLGLIFYAHAKCLPKSDCDRTDSMCGPRGKNSPTRTCTNGRDRRYWTNSDENGAQHTHGLRMFAGNEIERAASIQKP